MSTALAIKPEALPAWRALCGALAQLEDAGRSTFCTTDPGPFTSEDKDERREAAEACAACPAVAACRRFADENGEPAHVWGGVDRGPRAYSRKTGGGSTTGCATSPDPTRNKKSTRGDQALRHLNVFRQRRWPQCCMTP